MEIKESLLDKSKYSLKCPHSMNPNFIIVHDTANDAPAKNEVSYMKNNFSSTSFHMAVDDIEAIQAIPFDRNTWNCGDGGKGNGNRNGISIEICYSKSGGARWEKAKANAVEVIVQLLKQYGWGIEQVKKHQDFNGKYCPHRILDEGWENFLNLIKEKLGQTVAENTTVQNAYTYKDFVREVQACIGAKVDGIAGKETLSKTVTVSKTKNSRHAVVKPIQRYLNASGYDCGQVDGIAGNKFDKCVKRFQKDHGCVQDGEITARNKTWKKLLKLA